MNFAHAHLILNHIPIVGIPVALAFLVYGIFWKNSGTERFALLVLIGLGAMMIPVYLTGEPAEELVEHLPGVAESFIEAHEDAALISLSLTALSGAGAFLALWTQKGSAKSRSLSLGVIGIASLAVISLLYTANLGGKIRHTELRSTMEAQAVRVGESAESKEKDDD